MPLFSCSPSNKAFICVQPCDPRLESEDEVTDGKKLLGDKFVDFIPSPMRRFRAYEMEKTEVTFGSRNTSETALSWCSS